MIGLDYTHTHCEQRKWEEEKGMPTVVLKGEKTKMIKAKVVPSKRMDACAVDSVRRALEQLGHRRITYTEERRRASDTRVEGGSKERE